MNQIHTYQAGKDQYNGAPNEGASLMASACQDQMRALIGLLRRMVRKSAEPLDFLMVRAVIVNYYQRKDIICRKNTFLHSVLIQN